MKKISLVLLILTLISCTGNKQNQVPLFNELSFKMQSGESNVEIDSDAKTQYQKYFTYQFIQIPLFKHIHHSDYEIFIGIPFNTSLDAMVKNQLQKPDSLKIYLKSDSTRFFNSYKTDSCYVTEFANKLASNTLIYVSVLTRSKELSDSLFKESELTKRINTNH